MPVRHPVRVASCQLLVVSFTYHSTYISPLPLAPPYFLTVHRLLLTVYYLLLTIPQSIV